ncbi:MAG: helix-turn-helix domain-containing protein [Clostridia bacterium]|nr:helix-turn-helix domain-containing protein [Clostridia bacterium]
MYYHENYITNRRFRQSVVSDSFKFSVQTAVIRFNVSRDSVYRWRKRFNGDTFS